MGKDGNPLSFKNILAGIIVTVVGGLILAYLLDIIPSKGASSTPPETPTEAMKGTAVIPISGSPTVEMPTPGPRMWNFKVCPAQCDGTNAMRIFPEKSKKLYVEWDYENIPAGSHYVRSWSMEGQEWVRYDCIWQGAESGTSSIMLREPDGLHSGIWEIAISVDGVELLREQIEIQGSWDYWFPVGVMGTCFDENP